MVTGYQNKEIKSTVPVPLQNVVIGTFTEDYHLSEVEFERIKTGQPKTLGFALSLLGITIGFAVSAIPEIIDKGFSVVSSGDWKTFVLLAAATVLSSIVGWFLPNKRKTALKRIDEHFELAEPSKQALERGET